MVKHLPDERRIFIYITKERERLLQQVSFLRMMYYKFESVVLNFYCILSKTFASGTEVSFSRSPSSSLRLRHG